MKKKNVVWPQYVKNSQGKTTHVYLPMDAYEAITKELNEYDTLKKRKGIKWVCASVTKAKKKRA